MPSRTQRHLELLALSQQLRRYACDLEPDANACLFLVHSAMSRAFAEPAEAMRPSAGLEASLRADIDHGFRSSDARA